MTVTNTMNRELPETVLVGRVVGVLAALVVRLFVVVFRLVVVRLPVCVLRRAVACECWRWRGCRGGAGVASGGGEGC